MSNLNERAMLASLNCSAWSGLVHDKEVSEEVSENHKAEKDAGRYSKQIVARRFLNHVNSKVNVAKRIHRLLTLPWSDDGTRILSAIGHPHYMKQMHIQRLGVDAAAIEFSKNMQQYITEAKVRLGTMFNANEYPTAEEVVKKFAIDVEIKPIPVAGDFRAELSAASVKAITKDIEERSKRRIEAAMNDVFERINEHVGKMVEKLRAYKPAVGEDQPAENLFRDSLVYNVRELAEILPSLNITNDKRITQLQKLLLEELTEHPPEILRIDAKKRSDTANKAEKLLKKVSQYMA